MTPSMGWTSSPCCEECHEANTPACFAERALRSFWRVCFSIFVFCSAEERSMFFFALRSPISGKKFLVLAAASGLLAV